MLKTEMARLQIAHRGLVKAGLMSIRAAWKFGDACWELSETQHYTQKEMGEVVGLGASRIGDYMALRRIFETEDAVVAEATTTGHYDVSFLIGHRRSRSSSNQGHRHDLYDLVCADDGGEVACVVCGGKHFRRQYRNHD